MSLIILTAALSLIVNCVCSVAVFVISDYLRMKAGRPTFFCFKEINPANRRQHYEWGKHRLTHAQTLSLIFKCQPPPEPS